jgi:hypothetical protein
MEYSKIGIRVYRKYSDKYNKDINCIYSNKYIKIRYINHFLFGIRMHKRYGI